ncbi:phosphatidylinositol 4-kinase [Scheffersomyces xylosifermentans]|uniref:phosphatidylinositol 4-kinase n=1 Tax=Scheffersomyces xylosifermentans TaxID=1304137 RepID=UPI00315C9376
MSQAENAELLKNIRSSEFTPFQCIDYMRRYSHNIGIHHTVVKKLNGYAYDELEFCIPQFVQLLVSFETDSMALEDFLLDYCSRYPHFSLIVFWYLQAYIFELRNDPESYSFQVVRKFNNKLQNILFNAEEFNKKTSEFRENLQPALVLCGTIATAFAIPRFNDYALPLVKSQGNQQKSFVFKLANFQKALTKNLTLKNKRLSSETVPSSMSDDEQGVTEPRKPYEHHQRSASVPRMLPKKSLTLSSDESEYTTDEEEKASMELRREVPFGYWKDNSRIKKATYSEIEESLRINTTIRSKKSAQFNRRDNKTIEALARTDQYNLNSHSLPDLSKTEVTPYLSPAESESSLSFAHTSTEMGLKRNLSQHSTTARVPSYTELLRKIQVNYAKKETQFIMSLQNVSIRLSQVPKEARLSALRAELSIINETLLPSEIDIPQLLPITSNKNKKYHKILRLSINEACVLNSAERVPFLLLIEYLSDEMDFNPFTEYNQKIIASKNSSNDSKTKEISGDIAYITETIAESTSVAESIGDENISTEQIEADLGDLPMATQSTQSREWVSKSVESPDRISRISTEERSVTPLISSASDTSTKVLADQMRIASVMLQQLESSGQSTSQQFIAIKNRIVDSMISLQDQFDSIDYEKLNQLKGDNPDAGQRKLENDFKLAEDWNVKKQRIRKSSIYGHLSNWDLCSVIAKNGDDLPQEAFACQLISIISSIWKNKGVGVWTKRMKILITSANAGLVETITNAMSIHSIKKSLTEISINEGANSNGRIFTLSDYFSKMYGSPDSRKYKHAQDNFARSLASYSIICYVLQIKDRHNGNIMLDNEGHIIHIDFGFLLSNSPGSVGFEAAPFKLTTEYVDLLGGPEGAPYLKFVDLCKKCFNSLRKESDQIVNVVELMQKDSTLPCFKNGENTSVLLKQRLQLQMTDEESDQFVESTLIGRSVGSMYTRLYDQFQMITQGIYN